MADDELRAALRRLYVALLADRERWAKSSADGAVARAVAYQSAAARLLVVLDQNPPATAQYLQAPHDDLTGHGGVPRENLGGLY